MDNSFEAGFRNLKKVTQEKGKIGVGRAGIQLLNDSVMERPTVPHKEGTLRGSGSVHVQGELISTSPQPEGKGTPMIGVIGAIFNDLKITAHVGFNTPYASHLHESIGFKFTEPSSGSKYLQSKMSKNRNRYAKIIFNAVKL